MAFIYFLKTISFEIIINTDQWLYKRNKNNNNNLNKYRWIIIFCIENAFLKLLWSKLFNEKKNICIYHWNT